jgi:hypothetical protein
LHCEWDHRAHPGSVGNLQAVASARRPRRLWSTDTTATLSSD